MKLGNHLFDARKKVGLSQENVAEKLGVSRQTISKWETDETIPDIYQSKRLAKLYGLTLDELVDFDLDVKELEETIDKTPDDVQQKVDWTKVWAKKYPVLASYPEQVDVAEYAAQLSELLKKLRADYGYNQVDALLVLKDILGKTGLAK
ncbi:helix-turn-helix transcriptional regulator [Lacticaseibacillus pabuli]|uniref:Helix-turn-helix transcriptional regulator n=1 Tax=Lacticaseibacillus pabuli TaxID=3025672 RepID=A0ABY7WWA2_9LACO|nr:helix-turn-helix transcriptional regulator [Lacticaseibacillus sp. KACC 23028]WDF83242.1 helix-turn-helix transcriptional regulator [Lacticaseibacillus sp. KACC 23028]